MKSPEKAKNRKYMTGSVMYTDRMSFIMNTIHSATMCPAMTEHITVRMKNPSVSTQHNTSIII
jgi:hypothetical protein